MSVLIWNLLRFNGRLPDEIIVKILYEFRGLEHPLVKILLDFTKNKAYENYQRSRISKVLEKMYREDGEVSDRILRELNSYHGEARGYSLNMYVNYTDPGYYMKRRFGHLCYELVPGKNDGYNLNYVQSISRYWKLYRSNKIICHLRCKKCNIQINYWLNSKFKPSDFNTYRYDIGGFYSDKQVTWMDLLKEIEDKYNVNYKTYSQLVCFHCKEKSNDC